jgi:outer membrane biosynthesis protein TonB
MHLHKSFWTLAASAVLVVALPSAASAQAMAVQATCKDGTMSPAGKGACSGHGGVDKKATKAMAMKATAAAAANPGATVAATAKPSGKPMPAPAAAKPTAPAPAPAAAKPAPTTAAKPVAAPAPAPAPVPAAAPAPAPSKPAATKSVKPAAVPTTAAGKDGPPTAKCKDGTMSYAKGHAGACSRHGGVAEWLDGTAKKP